MRFNPSFTRQTSWDSTGRLGYKIKKLSIGFHKHASTVAIGDLVSTVNVDIQD